jgi:hypothetical protein
MAASDSKYDTPPATPEQKAAARAAPGQSHEPRPASSFRSTPTQSEAKEADVADGEILVNTDPRAVEIVKGFDM